MSCFLCVSYEKNPVGIITATSLGVMQFQYDSAWSSAKGSFPISLSLPLDGSFSAEDSHHFFTNLLPEGSVREQICKSLKISIHNDFELLKALGGDCAGALTITDSEIATPTEPESGYVPITQEQLSLWAMGASNAISTVTGLKGVRLSLAGAQDKLPVHIDGDQILLPFGNMPSTYILKFASPHYSHLPENETFITELAKQVGLPTVDVQVRKLDKASFGLIARYDRRLELGRWRRLHQEDFCQALGISAARKYEKEGGPTLKRCAEIIRKYSTYPILDLQKLMRWSLFNLLVANADAHGKNLSLLYDMTNSPSLAPFYDLVCTRNYKSLSREMAMNFGGAWDSDIVTPKHFEAVANDFGVRPKVFLEEVHQFAERVQDALPIAIAAYTTRFGLSPILERLPIIIRKQLRRLRAQLK